MHQYPLLFISIILLNACSLTTSTKQSPYQDEQNARVTAKAEELLQSGKTIEAALFYQHLAKQYPQQKDRYFLLAAQYHLQAGNSSDAYALIVQINVNALSAQQRNHYYLLHAQALLSQGEAEQALQYMDKVSLEQLEHDKKRDYHQSRAFADSLTGKLLDSTEQRIKLGNYLGSAEEAHDNNVVIFETLQLLSSSALKQSYPERSLQLQAWIQLTAILKNPDNDAEIMELQINRWRKTYSKHPANNNFLDQYLAENRRLIVHNPRHIALFLPESGRYAKAAASVKSGFTAAYNLDDYVNKAIVKHYDSSTGNIATLYQKAVAEGAELIIGPLDKANVLQLKQIDKLTAPVLTLNHVPELANNNIYQFGLSPIDDAQQITIQAFEDGKQQAMLLLPDTELGHRLDQYLTQFWQQSQGTVVHRQFYNPSIRDYSKTVKQLLNIDESERRYQRLKRLLPSIQFSARRRSESVALFLSGSANTLRLLNPQLHYFGAKNLARYATSSVYNNHQNPKQDIDLNGIKFCTIPWVLDHNYLGGLSFNALKSQGVQFSAGTSKLLALGIDAYLLTNRLFNLEQHTTYGATGLLSLNSDNRIKRTLSCAKFRNGIARNLSTMHYEAPFNEDIQGTQEKHNPTHD